MSFRYAPVAAQAPSIQSLRTICPISTNSGVATAANLTIAGNINSPIANVAIQYRLHGTTTNLGTVLTDAQGKFYFEPTGLSSGPDTIEVRALQWNEAAGSYLDSSTANGWTQLPFDYEPTTTTTTATLLDLELADPVAAGVSIATDPTISGHVMVSDSGPLAGVTVQLSTSSSGSPEQSTTTDAQGAFSLTLVGLSYESQTIYARTIRYDQNTGQSYISGWTTTGISPLTFDYQPTPSFINVSEVYATGTNTLEVVGQITPSPSAAAGTLHVQFDPVGNGTPNGSVCVTSTDGSFTYQPSSFDPAQQQMRVRVQEKPGVRQLHL